MRGPGIAQPLTPRHRGPDRRLLTGLGGVVVRLHTTIAPAFLFSLVCREARKKISSCEALHFQKLCCLMPLSVELDVSLLLPSLVHKQKRACRAPAVWSGGEGGRSIPLCRQQESWRQRDTPPPRTNRHVEEQAGKLAGHRATVAGEVGICSQLTQPCGTLRCFMPDTLGNSKSRPSTYALQKNLACLYCTCHCNTHTHLRWLQPACRAALCRQNIRLV